MEDPCVVCGGNGMQTLMMSCCYGSHYIQTLMIAIGGALELIQSFNTPKTIDAPDSSLQEGKLHSRWKPLTILRDFLQLPKLFIEMEDKLFSGAFKVII